MTRARSLMEADGDVGDSGMNGAGKVVIVAAMPFLAGAGRAQTPPVPVSGVAE
ncbi:hypothetical protein [Sphingomonas gellani]|uniref:hypothetical protein n=1 Tax=Sphingomonas gellani TaxID=1166340 RepID=UPI00147A5918|nr:hypothetical protein [Sphingomonas gellani]